MTAPKSNTARALAREWNLDVRHALYRKTGDWYHQLERFPGALLDEYGYVVFETEDAYRSCPELKINQDVGVPGGISKIPGYTIGIPGGPTQQITYERATFQEGARRDVVQSQIERNRAARDACIAVHGSTCAVCGFNFGAVYGALGEGFIHVHHCNPVSLGVRDVDPVSEMRPLCPNCHAMVHREDPPLSIEVLQALVRAKA
jgi:HNH endonuclease